MKYASETCLRYVFSKIHDLDDSTPLMQLLDEAIDTCKELPTPQWQPIEEFKANPVEGLCFIMYCNCRLHSVYRSGKFENNGMFYSARDITHVMPIKTPEAPK